MRIENIKQFYLYFEFFFGFCIFHCKMSSLCDKVYDKVKETVRLLAIYSVGSFWTIVVVVIPLLKDIFINREDVFTIKDRSERKLFYL
jgi:hypothetical protein